MTIQAGVVAPDFPLPDENNEIRSISEFRGQLLVLYFYPKDDTPGWTVEARGFRDDYDRYTEAGISIVGVSADTPESHQKFKNKYGLPFTLLADVDKQMCNAYGVWGEKEFMGKKYEGIHRTTFLIGPDGLIAHVFENVSPKKHSDEVLAVINDGI